MIETNSFDKLIFVVNLLPAMRSRGNNDLLVLQQTDDRHYPTTPTLKAGADMS